MDPHQKDTLTVPSYPVTSFQIKLPDSMLNQRQDIEAMFVDPLSTNSLYLFTKRTNKVVVLKVDPPFQNQSIKLAVEVARLTFNGATAADISPNGKMIVVRTYSTAFVWERDGTITQSLQKAPCIVSNITENQGEAITIQDDGSFFTTSEGSSAVPIWFYQNTSQ